MKVVLDHLTKRFPNRNKKGDDVIAVNDFTFEIPDGKLIGLLGPSGCGKSTTLNLICGLEPPTEGRIFFGDDDVTRLPPENRGVGLVFQNYALYPHLTVRENILFPLQNLKGKNKLPKAEMEERALAVAKLVQIEGLMERKPSEMSGGQQQRVAIARALVKIPKVLLLDEPLSNLDARLRLQTREEIRRIQQETGITTIFVTHDQDEAMVMSDMIHLFHEGKIEQSGSPDQIYTRPATKFAATFIGNYNLPSAAEFNRVFKTDIPGEDVAVRPEIIQLSKTAPQKEEGLLTAEGKIVSHISHGNLVRFSVQFDRLTMNADVVYENRMDFHEGDAVFAAIRQELVIGL